MMKEERIRWLLLTPALLLVGMLLYNMVHSHTAHDPRRIRAISKLERLGHALDEYRSAHNQCPAFLQDLRDFEPAQIFLGTNSDIFTDSWGHAFVYEPAGTNCTLLCLGPDGKRGTQDDLRRF